MKIGWLIVPSVGVLVGLLVAAACGGEEPTPTPTSTPRPAATSTPTPTKAAWEIEWEQTIEAANKEGKLVLFTPAGTPPQELVAAFERQFPDIEVEHSQGRISDFSPKVVAEQKGSVYAWDVHAGFTGNPVVVLTPAEALEDIRPYLVLPDATDDRKWALGFEYWGSDLSNLPYVLVTGADVSGGFGVNRDLAPEPDFPSDDPAAAIQQLVDPKWKGKIMIDDPGTFGHGSLGLSTIFAEKDRDKEFLRKLMIDQEPVYVEHIRTLTEWLCTGRYAIAIYPDENFLANFREAGACPSVEESLGRQFFSTRAVMVFKNPPHPNAAKVFVNWLLSKEGQTAYVEAGVGNSRRLDVPVQDPIEQPDYSRHETYVKITQESGRGLTGSIIGFYKGQVLPNR